MNMSRLPFESEPLEPTHDRPLSVSTLAQRIKAAVAAGLPGKLRVVGEVSNFSDRSHWFFSLKDESATLRCVMFASAARRAPSGIGNGVQVVASGRVDFYDAQGSVQLYVDEIAPVGRGDLEQRLRELMEELRQLGYFDAELKRALPALPRTVAVVTSRAAAALQDVINTAQQRWAGCRLLLKDVRVQGEAAAEEIAHAIRQISRHGRKLGIDAVILTRGGGSIEDLWAFNERVVADAIYECAIPVVAAIGHETDTTVAELVADLRCATPTQAAMTLIPDAATLHHQADQLHERLTLLIKRRIEHARQRVDAAGRSRLIARPDQMLAPVRERLERLTRQLDQAAGRRVVQGLSRVDALDRQLRSVSPVSVLQRGYSYTLGPDGQLIRSQTQAKPGDRLITVLVDGRVTSVVDGAASPPAPKLKSRKPRRRVQGQDTLFE